MQQKEFTGADLDHQESKPVITQDPDKNKSSSGLSNNQSVVSILDQQLSPTDDETSLSSNLPLCSAPVCRQFWKAGSYEEELVSKPKIQNGRGYLHIHPRFLHSNATSHKWAFGAVAELLDNAIDEIQNGATFVLVDKTSNPRDGSPALLIQDDGGGMDPEAMRRCLSFGFSDKKSKSAIGQYGNGFKTSSMRLGADVIVFSRYLEERKLTQSIGLLSYTFLTQAGYDRIVVPMVDYQLNTSTGTFETMDQYGKEHSESNLSMLLQWSPYATEAELLKQFDDIGYHGTKVIIYNLWQSDKGTLELDFESDAEDIRLTEDAKIKEKFKKSVAISETHMANRLRYSLRVYLSILYLRLPETFKIILRGRIVECHNIAADLKFPEFILYKPHSGGCVEGTVLTTIGFLKEAPHVNIHGFNVYHKNRLILPFWHVVSFSDSRGRGVVGVLEANFIEPTHNKQEFEKTTVFQKLENRLKEMTWEYWDYHCGLIGYQVKKKLPAPTPSKDTASSRPRTFVQQPVLLSNGSSKVSTARAPLDGIAARWPPAATSSNYVGRAVPVNLLPKVEKDTQQGNIMKRKEQHMTDSERHKRRAGVVDAISAEFAHEMQPVHTFGTQLAGQVDASLLEENKKLRAQCLEYENREKVMNLKAEQLRRELEAVQQEFAQMMAEVELLDNVKQENNIR